MGTSYACGSVLCSIRAAARRADVPVDEIVEVGPGVPQLSGRLRDWADAIG